MVRFKGKGFGGALVAFAGVICALSLNGDADGVHSRDASVEDRSAASVAAVDPALAAEARRAGVDSGWLARAVGYIERSQYFIEPDESAHGVTHRAWNNAQGLQFEYAGAAFEVRPSSAEANEAEWSVGLRLAGVRRGDASVIPFEGERFEAVENRASIEDENVSVLYENTATGMRQDFLVKERPAGAGRLRVEIGVETDLHLRATSTSACFERADGSVAMQYRDLKVTDAGGRPLAAWMEATAGRLALVVDDTDAGYPVLVDPVASTADDSMDPIDQTDATFGFCVSSAGDVDGDDLSDLLIVAPGVGSNGTVYVFLAEDGFSSSVTPAWSATPSGSGDLGVCCSAGDMDNDGLSDIAVSAPLYGSNQGRVWVYRTENASGGALFGGAILIGTGSTNERFGFSIACAGDVNDDNAADLIVGAPGAFGNEGLVYLYRGHKDADPSTTPDKEINAPESVNDSDHFGHSVAGAGNVNGDAFSDIVVSAPYYDTDVNGDFIPEVNNLGRVYVYHGKSGSGGLPANPNRTIDFPRVPITNSEDNTFFGWVVVGAGDTDGDGYADIAVGTPFADGGINEDQGRVDIFRGSSTGILPGETAVLSLATDEDAHFGIAIAAGMDFNGDGLADIAVGAPGVAAPQGGTSGRVYQWAGRLDGNPIYLGEIQAGSGAPGEFGSVIANGGDVTGDGLSDLVVGEPEYSSASYTAEGRVSIYHGCADGLSETPSEHDESDASALAFAVARAGDVNGDGYSDVVVGAPDAASEDGRAYVYYGTDEGLPEDWDKRLNPSSLTNGTDPHFGAAVAGAGDVNRDGYEDVLVGAPGYEASGNSNNGRVFLFKGSSTGLGGSVAWKVTGDSGDETGTSVAGAGCVDDDGFADVVIGSPGAGEVALYLGQSGNGGLPNNPSQNPLTSTGLDALGTVVFGLGDVDGDGNNDVAAADPEDGTVNVYFGTSTGLGTSPTAISNASMAFGSSLGAGDFNADGLSDLVVGAPEFDDGGDTDEGRVYVYHGGTTFDTTADTTLLPTKDDGSAESQDGVLFGSSVAAADVNGDGFSDLVVGASGWDSASITDEGRAYVFHGGSSGLDTSVLLWLDPTNDASARFGVSAAPAGDVNGDGYADVVVGADGFDLPGANDAGRAYLFYGNQGPGASRRVRQYRFDTLPGLVGPYQNSGHATKAQFGIYARSFLGKTDVRAEFTVREMDGDPVADPTVSDWESTTTSGTNIKKKVTGLTADTRYTWFGRIRYRLNKGAVQPLGPRHFVGFNGAREADFRTN